MLGHFWGTFSSKGLSVPTPWLHPIFVRKTLHYARKIKREREGFGQFCLVSPGVGSCSMQQPRRTPSTSFPSLTGSTKTAESLRLLGSHSNGSLLMWCSNLDIRLGAYMGSWQSRPSTTTTNANKKMRNILGQAHEFIQHPSLALANGPRVKRGYAGDANCREVLATDAAIRFSVVLLVLGLVGQKVGGRSPCRAPGIPSCSGGPLTSGGKAFSQPWLNCRIEIQGLLKCSSIERILE